MCNRKGPKQEKIPPTPGFELQVTRCLVGTTLSSPPGGMDFFLKPKIYFNILVVNLYYLYTPWAIDPLIAPNCNNLNMTIFSTSTQKSHILQYIYFYNESVYFKGALYNLSMTSHT